MKTYIYSRCPDCGHTNVHVEDGRLLSHWDHTEGKECGGSGHIATEIRVTALPTGSTRVRKDCPAADERSVAAMRKADSTVDPVRKFGQYVLEAMEACKDWNSDLWDDISAKASELNLSDATEVDGFFKVKR